MSELQARWAVTDSSMFNSFYLRATDGKIVNSEIMKVYYNLMDKYLEIGVTTPEDVEDLKALQGDFQVSMNRKNPSLGLRCSYIILLLNYI